MNIKVEVRVMITVRENLLQTKMSKILQVVQGNQTLFIVQANTRKRAEMIL